VPLRDGVRDATKRAIDFTGALLGLIVTSPLLVAAMVGVRLSLGSPVLFRQERIGFHGRPFTLLKLRTMRGAAVPGREGVDDDARLSPLGRFLRRTSIDELPQLINVLRGDMSLVGPRPLLRDYLPLYTAEQARRHDVRPGITGWTQITGRNALSWDEKFARDVWYVAHRSTWLDLRILIRTIAGVIAGAGVSARDHATMPRFSGRASASPAVHESGRSADDVGV
jgi:sugar transferase EpsL